MDISVSIIVPVYNVENYIEQCLDSIRCQTLKNIEVIMVDDGSKDTSGKICDEYVKKDKRFKVFHTPNKGALAARNYGINIAGGRYIGFADPDDWIEPDMFEILYKKAVESKAQVTIANKYIYDDILQTSFAEKTFLEEGTYLNQQEQIVCSLLENDSLNLWDKLFAREVLVNNYTKIDLRLHYFEDVSLVLTVLMNAACVHVVNRPLYFYRQRECSMCHSRDKEYLEQLSIFYNSVGGLFEGREKILKLLDGYVAGRAIHALNQMMGLKLKHKIPYWIPPFEEFQYQSKVVLYGAGEVGKSFYQMFQYVNPAQICLWVDKKADIYAQEIPMIAPVSKLQDCEFDKILIAVKSEDSALQIMNNLKDMGINPDKMVWSRPRPIIE